MANFICKNCEYPFSERVQIKLKYEGVIVNRKDVPLPIFDEPRKAEEAMLGNMKLNIAENGVGYLTFNAFEGVSGIKHAFSTRIGGLSKGIFADMNLGLRRGDDDELVLKNFDLFCEAINVDRKTLVAGAQEHHTNIKRVTALDGGNGIDLPKKWEDVDGLCTNEEEITLIVYAADCVPLYFYDAKNRAIGLAHAGWRGTVSNMAGVMVERMAEEFGTLPEDLLCAIGPSIGPESFEVDPPCAEEFLKLDSHEKFVKDDGNGKFHVNLWETNRQLLLKAGVKAENISVGEVDSYKEGSLIFSHRRTRGQRGSNAAFLTLKRIDE